MDSPIVDAQQHVWSADSPLTEWRLRGWPEEWGCEDALKLIDGAGVDKAVLVTPRWQGFDPSFALACAKAYPDRFAVVGLMDWAAEDARIRFQDLIAWPGFVGFRILFSGGLGDHLLANGHLRGGPMEWVFDAAEAAGVPLAFLLTDTAPEFAELGLVASDHPKLPLIVDHAGKVPGPEPFARLPELLKLGRWDNIYVKLTGLPPTTIDLAWITPERASPFPFMDPVVKSIVDAFGSRRCMWGSDVNKFVGLRTLNEIVDQFRIGCPFLSDEDRAWILGRTAAQVYRLTVKSTA